VTFFFLADLFFSPITIIGTQLSEATLAMAGAERYFRVLDTSSWTDKPGAGECPRLQGRGVVIRDVGFAYVPDRPGAPRRQLRRPEPGQVIALVGHTGSGKSTVIGLLAKFQLPLSGQVLVDGHDLADLRQETLRRQMGFVFQQNFLFAGTIAENVKAARPDAADEEIRQAFRDLDRLDLIEALPEGIHTPCSEKGRGSRWVRAAAGRLCPRPAGGTRASSSSTRPRAPSIRSTEARLQVALTRLMKGRTSFVVAHRLSTIRRAVLRARPGRRPHRRTRHARRTSGPARRLRGAAPGFPEFHDLTDFSEPRREQDRTSGDGRPLPASAGLDGSSTMLVGEAGASPLVSTGT
jgi:ATP-binding cassette subfamily B protein